eukprot:5465517-Amphidinium_carterae.1
MFAYVSEGMWEPEAGIPTVMGFVVLHGFETLSQKESPMPFSMLLYDMSCSRKVLNRRAEDASLEGDGDLAFSLRVKELG